MTKGGRNLIILGLAASLVAISTTSVALAVYHNSGDIYLDRSRPGFLPDKEEIEEEVPEEGYDFDTEAPVTAEGLDLYLEKLSEEVKALEGAAEPFSAEALSDEKLGI